MSADGQRNPTTPGRLVETHFNGHCLKQVSEDRLCMAPAVTHMWIGAQDDPEAWNTFVCSAHLPELVTDALDWHQVQGPCLAHESRRRWRFTGTAGQSWCLDDDFPDVGKIVAQTSDQQVVPSPSGGL